MQFAVSEFPQIIREVVRTGIARFDAQAFPFLSRRSEDAAEAAECAADQGATGRTESVCSIRSTAYAPERT